MKKEYDFLKMKGTKNPYAKQSSVSYQTLIHLYLLDCVKSKKKPKFDWAV